MRGVFPCEFMDRGVDLLQGYGIGGSAKSCFPGRSKGSGSGLNQEGADRAGGAWLRVLA